MSINSFTPVPEELPEVAEHEEQAEDETMEQNAAEKTVLNTKRKTEDDNEKFDSPV